MIRSVRTPPPLISATSASSRPRIASAMKSPRFVSPVRSGARRASSGTVVRPISVASSRPSRVS